MLKVKTEVRPSDIHGLGLFVLENVEKGQVVHQESPLLDLALDVETFSILDSEEKSFIEHYGWFDQDDGKYHLNFDHSRFINHSSSANLTFDVSKKADVAKRDINAGEELTVDYKEFEETDLS